MDKNNLKFWGTMLNQAAENQQGIEDMAKWVNEGMKASVSFVDIFKDFKNAGNGTMGKPQVPDGDELARELKKSFDDFLTIFNMVPRSRYIALAKKYEDLKKIVEHQKETIDHLRMMVDEKSGSAESSMKAFSDMAEEQTRQFASLMKSFGSLYQKDKPNDS